MMRYAGFLLLLLYCATVQAYTRQDSLRGGNGPGRSWWDVQRYVLMLDIDTERQSIRGANTITLQVTGTPHDSLQVDLQDGMFLDSVRWKGRRLDFAKEGNVFWVKFPFSGWTAGRQEELVLNYHGKPRRAKLPPWDGGLIWTKDSLRNPWSAVACQGLGASAWWPCKDYQGDEPDSGMSLYIAYPCCADVISNGRGTTFGGSRTEPGLTIMSQGADSSERMVCYRFSTMPWLWQIRSPINTYSATFYIGDYAHWHDTLIGEKGVLDLDFYPLRHNEAKARRQFSVARQMIHCFEYWMGPYPFYEDGYKLVEAPYLGMEHQSAVAYGNEYKMGYRGTDRSGTGIGLLFDFIIVHESGHEWFGNSITAQDIADNWLHEGFTTYTEGLFVECATSRDSAFRYIRGEWSNIRNDRPVTGDYGVNDDGSSDKYDKGAAVVHMIRMIMDNDDRFRQLLRGLNRDFYHRIVTGDTVEAYISRFAGRELKPLFDQYLRTANIPVLEYYTRKKKLHYRFANVVPGFSLPVPARSRRQQQRLDISGQWQEVRWKGRDEIRFSPDFLYREHYVLDTDDAR